MGGAGIRKPRAVLAVWLVVLSVLGALGLGVEDRLTRSDIGVPGTRSAEARELAKEHFGESHTLAVLLEGPRRDVARQGRALALRLERRPDISVVGPWSRGMPRQLREQGDSALLLVRVDRPFNEVSETVVPRVRADVARAVSKPVASHVTGYADVASGVHRESVQALTRAELIAAPLLMVVLLLVFRSVVAAALPLALGMATIGAARGVIELINRFHAVDVVALNMASMMGLALGVDYALVLVSRFREELAAGAEPREAARIAAGTAGRTVLFAGIALGAAMTAALALAPGNLMASSGIGVLTAVALSVALATIAMPAALVLLGTRVDKWSFGRRGASGAETGQRASAVALRLIRRPAVAAAVVMGVLAALSAPALALNLGPPDPRNLPPSSPERADFERLAEVLGTGWGAPYELIVATRDGRRVTDPATLRRLDAWQSRIARDRSVSAVMGPAVIARGARRLDDVQRGLGSAQSTLTRAQRDQRRLAHGLGRVEKGVGQLRGGLALAVDGAGRLSQGAGDAADGAARVGEGIAMAEAGAARLLSGLREARAGAGALRTGGAKLSSGARRLQAGLARARRSSREALPRIRELRDGLATGSEGLQELRRPVQIADRELGEALAGLDGMLATSKADPRYAQVYESVATASGAVTGVHPLTKQKVYPEYDGLDAELAGASQRLSVASAGVAELERGSGELVAGLGRLERGAGRLVTGIDSLERGTERLLGGLRRLERGGGSLHDGLSRLVTGSQALADGSGSLAAGAGRLSGGLSDGAARTQALSDGVARMHSGVVAGRARTDRMARDFSADRIDTRMFDSGYLPLAALDKAPAGDRSASTFALNLDGGGDAARLVVVQDGDPSRAGTPLRERLERYADQMARDTGTRVAVGGPAATLQDFDAAATSRLPLLAVALVLVTYLALVPTLRSLVLPALAVVLNLLTVAAAFGVLALLFTGAAPLGGAGDLDGIMVLAIFGIVFGLSIDYEVFLLARMREGWLRTGDTDGAVTYGLQKTAGVITGAALIMTGVFVAFALSPIASMRQLGIGLTVAVLLDATLVRLVLLPAAIRLAGRANWWLPGWLDRLLPSVDVEGESVGEAGGGSNGGGNGTGHRNGNGSAGSVTPELRHAIEQARSAAPAS
jgi:RND superfamily putative drug exporter